MPEPYEPEAPGSSVPDEALANIDRAAVSGPGPTSRRAATGHRPDGPGRAQRVRGRRDARVPAQHRAFPRCSAAASAWRRCWSRRTSTVTCPEERVIAFLAGELAPEEERRFDQHLLECEECWQAVKADRAARLALEQLRQPAPAGLESRVALAIALAAQETSKGAEPTAPGYRPSCAGRRCVPTTPAWWRRPAWSSSWPPALPVGSSPTARRPTLPSWPPSSP